MKKISLIILSLVFAMGCVCVANAETITLTGTVVCSGIEDVLANVSGTVENVLVHAGQKVEAGETLATVETTKVYAEQNGTVYLFGEEGENAAGVANRYGAVAYIEADYQYTISGTTRNAYDKEENYIIHPGEKVYLRCYADGKHTGEGLITAVSGNSYTVEVTAGSFEYGETITIYRDSAYTATSRIGRGNLSRLDPVAYTGEGTIIRFHAENNSPVKKGDPLFETVNGTIKSTDDGNAISTDKAGVVYSANVSAGSVLEENTSVATLYPDENMRIEALVSESELNRITTGTQVKIEFIYMEQGDIQLTGVVESVSLIPVENTDTEEEEASYTVIILPQDIAQLRYGMNVTVTTIEE